MKEKIDFSDTNKLIDQIIALRDEIALGPIKSCVLGISDIELAYVCLEEELNVSNAIL